MKYLVTGAAGFIGSALSKTLAEKGHNLICVDNFSDYYSKELKNLRVSKLLKPHSIDVFNVDVSHKSVIDSLIAKEKPDAVIHLAAQAGVRLSLTDNYKYVESNLVGFSNILSSVVQNEIPSFLYASSSSVYGDNARIPFSEKDTNLNPNSFYGATKLSNELLAPTLIRNSKTRSRGLRFFTVYGPWGRPDMAYFRIASSLLNNKVFSLFGNGEIERDFTYIEDAVSICISLLNELNTHETGFSDIVNIGGGRPLSIKFLISQLEKTLKLKIKLNIIDGSASDSAITMAAQDYLTSLIGMHKFTSLEEGLVLFSNWCESLNSRETLERWIQSSK